MDLTITSTQLDNPVDTRWRASRHGQFTAQPGTLDVSKFVAGTHFNIGGRTDGIIPSGVAVQYNESSKMYEPWNAAAASAGAWAGTTAVELGAYVLLAGGALLQATTAGTTGSSAPTAPGAVGGTVVDGTVTWTRRAAALPVAGYINDNQGIPAKRADGSAVAKAGFARLLHGILDASFLPIASQAAVVKTAAHTAQISFI